MAASTLGVWAGAIVLVVVFLPLGLAILRGVERVFRRRFSLSVLERGLLAFYASGGFLFVLASIPLPLFDTATLVSALIAGALVYGILVVRERGRSVRPAIEWGRSIPGAAVVLGTLALLALEIYPVAGRPFPNTWDGSASALWTNLTLSNHSAPWTLAPFAQAGVTYPMGSTAWMSASVLLLGWSDISSPLFLPPLFLTLSVPAAYCWGRRLSASKGPNADGFALLFAAFFGLVVSWPRLLVGGYYDFVLALPLLMVLIGTILPLTLGPPPKWNVVVALGLAVGVLSSLSPVATQALILTLIGYVLVFRRWSAREYAAWAGRCLALVAFGLLFLLRSVVGAITWYSYPGHTLVQTGVAGFAPPSTFGSLSERLVVNDLNPFAAVKFRMSPFPVMSLELQVLLALALGLAVVAYLGKSSKVRNLWPDHFVPALLVGTAALFALTTLSLLADFPGALSDALGALTNFDEASFLLFLSYQALGLVPLFAGLELLLRRREERSNRARMTETPADTLPALRNPRQGRSGSAAPVVIALAILVITVPLATGIALTSTQAPAFISQEVGKTSNVTQADRDALEWAGAHLPVCSAVLAAPGSAAQFLPEFATVHLVYQMNPTPWSSTYYSVVQNLTDGQYTNETRAGLLTLGVTEVFVTLQNSVTYPPFQSAPLQSSADFTVLFSEGDATIFAFDPGITSTGCPA